MKPRTDTNANNVDVRIVPSGTGTGSVGDITIGTTTGTTVSASNVASTYTSFSLTNNISKSGYLEVFSDTVRSLNNINNNNAYGTAKNNSNAQLTVTNAEVTDYNKAYNREPDYYTTKNVQLTDDRYLIMWDMKDTGVKNGYYPVMVMNGNNPVFGYVDSSGGKNSAAGTAAGTGAGTYRYTNAQAQRAEFNATTGAEIYTEYLVKQLNTNQMGMAMDEGGRFLQATVYDYEGAGFALYYDRYNEIHTPASGYGWGPGTGYNGYTGDFAQNVGNNAIVLETCSYPDSSYTAGRYQSPKLILDGNSKTGNAIVYMSYYDAATGEILFRNFIIGKSLENTSNSSIYYQKFEYVGTAGGYYYFSCDDASLNGKYVKIGNNYRQLTYNANVGGYYRIANNPISSDFSSIIYSNNSGTAMTIEKSSAMNTSGKDNSNTTYEDKVNFLENFSVSDQYDIGRLSVVSTGSKNFDMGVTSDNHVVIVYLDSSTNKLVLKYSTNTVDGSSPTTEVAWSTSTVDFPENIGSYVSLAVDGSSVHISAFDSYDSNLVYMYLPNYNSATGYKELTVDQASAVGNWAKVKVKNGIPYLAYYNSTESGGRESIKLAYPINANGKTNAQNMLESGVDVKPGSAYSIDGVSVATGYTTGAWEYLTIPAITPPQGGDPKFQQVCLDFDSNGNPVVGYLGTNLEFGKQRGE